MRTNPVRLVVSVPQAFWLAAAGVALFFVQVGRILAIGGVNPNLVLVFLVCLAAFTPRLWVPALIGSVIVVASVSWTPFDIGSVALAAGIGFAVAAAAPLLTGRSLSDAFILLAIAEIAWHAGTWRSGALLFTTLRAAGLGIAEHAALLVIFWFFFRRLAAGRTPR